MSEKITNGTDGEFAAAWRHWHDQREAGVVAPGGDLTLTGTHWLHGETVVEGVPGRWRVADGGVQVTGADGLTVDGVPARDAVVRQGQRLSVGRIDLVIIRRGDGTAVRVYDPDAAAVRDFAGIEVYPPDPAWTIASRFEPAAPERTERIRHSHSPLEGDYPVIGMFTFTVDGREVQMVGLDSGHPGEVHLTFRDRTSGPETYGACRFLWLPVPAAAGPVTLDFNRTQLPPCAFSDAFICPLPPAQNILPFAVTAGEKRLLTRS